MKEKTRLLLTASKARGKQHPRRLALSHLAYTKEGKRLQRQFTKARKAIAEHIRTIRQGDGHHLARVWARAGGC
jgi:hypothetical protein